MIIVSIVSREEARTNVVEEARDCSDDFVVEEAKEEGHAEALKTDENR